VLFVFAQLRVLKRLRFFRSAGLSGFAIFSAVATMLLSAFLLLVPVAYEKWDKFVQLARLLKEVRVSFILTGTGFVLNLLIAYASFSLSHAPQLPNRI
jgi:hypothetical protein